MHGMITPPLPFPVGETRHAPSRLYRDARVYCLNPTAMHDNEYSPHPPHMSGECAPPPLLLVLLPLGDPAVEV